MQALSFLSSAIRKSTLAVVLAGCAAGAGLLLPLQARAQSDASVALSLLPVASVVGTVSVAGAAAGAVIAVPVALSVGGAVLTVVAVDASVDGTTYLLERAADGARASVKLAGGMARGASVGVGTAVTVSVIGSGVVLSTAGEVLAFVPNALGRALLHNERLM